MRKIVDLHLHSKYSRATSKQLDLTELAKWGRIKGLDIISCADFTHPKWLTHIRETLVEDGSGLLDHPREKGIKFLLSTEVACIYSHAGSVRRLHHLILAPSLSAVEKINTALTVRGCKLASDGRPILGLSSKELLQIVLGADARCMLIPAHAWTPWFAIFGSKSGYDSVEDCFEDLAPHIHALETGLSSDPEMNWSLSKLDRYALVSNSDAHSGPKMGREANVFDLAETSYDAIVDAITSRDPRKFLYTIEFFPEEGMYHYDGHRLCDVNFAPFETRTRGELCPVCKKSLTIGVLHRVDNLRDRELGTRPTNTIPFKKIVPLPEIIADFFMVASSSKKVMELFFNIVHDGRSEFSVLLDMAHDELKKIMPEQLADGIMRVRSGDVRVIPGYDGKYGIVSVFSDIQRRHSKQETLL
ncbi:MAG: endonuclease Q family protein [Patescibacteria group bacterium]